MANEKEKVIATTILFVYGALLVATHLFVYRLGQKSLDPPELSAPGEVIEKCNILHYPVDVNMKEWRKCIEKE